MSCFRCGIPPMEEEDPLIVDVDKMLGDKAWNNFVYSHGYFTRKCIKRKNFVIEVPENYFVYETIEQSITNQGRGIRTGNNNSDGNVASSTNDMLKGNVPSHRPSNPEAVSLDTTFSNDTAEKQTYQFKFSKVRTTKVEVSYQKGFTIGGKASFSIGVPKILGDGTLGLDLEMQYQITKTQGQSFEESMTMEATSDISVGPKSNYLANVQMEERSVQAKFLVRTRMSMPQGKAPIYIRRKDDQTIVYVYVVKNIRDIFLDESPSVEAVKVDGASVRDQVDFVVEGVIKGSLACDHHINLTSDETEEEKKLAKQRRLQTEED